MATNISFIFRELYYLYVYLFSYFYLPLLVLNKVAGQFAENSTGSPSGHIEHLWVKYYYLAAGSVTDKTKRI